MRLAPLLAVALTAGLLAGGLVAPGAAFASASDTWTGTAGDGLWTTSGNWSSGVPQAGQSVVIAPTASQTMPAVTDVPDGTSLRDLTLTDSSLSGGAVTVNGTFTWSVSTGQAVLADPLTAEGSADISGAGEKIAMSQMTFDGDSDVSGTGVLETEFAGAAITNNGTFEIEPGSEVKGNACCADPNSFVNTGVLSVPGSAGGIATLDTLGLTIGGAIAVSVGSTLEVTAGQATFKHGSNVEDGGTLTFDLGETVALATQVTISSASTVQLTGTAIFTGTGGFVGAGIFLWTGGHVEGNLTNGAAVTTTMSGTGTKDASSPDGTPITVTLRGNSTLSDTGPLHLGAATTFVNAGKFTADSGTTIEASPCCASPDHFTNSGTFTAAAGKTPVTVSLLAFVNTGSVKLASKLIVDAVSYTQTAGVTYLAGGTLSSNQPVLINAGVLNGHGIVGATLVNGGTVSPSTAGGVLTVNGPYQQAKTGTFATVIAGTTPGSKFGQLVVEGVATLAGVIKVTTGGGFTPSKGQSFQVMRYHSHAGAFTSKSGSPSYTLAYSGSVQVRY